ncbi:ABC transporter substrate-binding protein [Streptomyces sp. NPDC006012]|uniref:ABC transporter substrate-binding protein n=1 Tax=Streptomyces sp. NPDC006012 TaxID=3364739 RepID=UPI0036771420
MRRAELGPAEPVDVNQSDGLTCRRSGAARPSRARPHRGGPPCTDAAKKFQKETGISVSVEAFTPEEAYMTKVQSAAKTGDLPDVLEVHSDGEGRVLGASGIAADLKDDYKGAWLDRIQSSVHESGLVTPERYEKSLSKKSTDNGIEKGARYSVPLTIGTFGIVYASKAKLAEAGIKEAPKTWEDLLAALKATTAKDPRTAA